VSLPVLTAVADSRAEAELAAAFDGNRYGVSVVRRCVDLADLLATAASGIARAAVLSADLRRLDRDALARLGDAGVAVVGVTASGDEASDRRLRQLGVSVVLGADAGAERVAQALSDAVARLDAAGPSVGYADPRIALRLSGSAEAGADAPALPTAGDDIERGRIVAVWGPTGGPGRSTVAAGLAAELAELGSSTLLIDADTYGGALHQLLGLLDESPGLASACRAAGQGSLDLPGLARLARQVGARLRVLTGLSRPDRWHELRPAALQAVLELARGLARTVVVDCGFSLEQDEELAFDAAAPRRNGATLTALGAADDVLVVGSAEPIGIARLVRAMDELADVHPEVSPTVVVNRVRPGCVGAGEPGAEIAAALERYAGVRQLVLLPQDIAACDAAVNAGRLLPETAARSALRAPLAELAARFAGLPKHRAAPRPVRARGLLARIAPLASRT
jgi:MinD-like ATPase involved in chromosome partitioning or flagellar assembly